MNSRSDKRFVVKKQSWVEMNLIYFSVTPSYLTSMQLMLGIQMCNNKHSSKKIPTCSVKTHFWELKWEKERSSRKFMVHRGCGKFSMSSSNRTRLHKIYFRLIPTRGQFHQTWAHIEKDKSADVQQNNKSVNFFFYWWLDCLLGLLGSAVVKAALMHIGEINPWFLLDLRSILYYSRD